jgi:hypothetical protein
LHDEIRAANTVVEADAGHMLINQLRAGSLDAAIVYQSNVQSSQEAADHIDLVPLPGAMAIQELAINRDTSHRYLLQRLRDVLTSAGTVRRFEECGFGVDKP